MPRLTFTKTALLALPSPEAGRAVYTDEKTPGLELRVTPSGARTFYVRRRVRGTGKVERITVGRFPEVTVEAARRVALGHVAALAEGRSVVATRQAERTQRAPLGGLLEAYADHLEAAGKVSASRVRSALHLHVRDAHPRLWRKPAAEVTPEDGVRIIGRLVEAGKAREAGKVRAYLRSAFASAIRARLNPSAPAGLRAFALRANPMADIVPPNDAAGGARERALSVAELRAYWRRIAGIPGAEGALLRFHLLTGAQRVEQLGRLTVDDLDREAATVRLLDTKGRRTKPRHHLVPVLPEAVEALDAMHGGEEGARLVTLTRGRTGAAYSSLQHRVRQVAAAMEDAGELERGAFTVGDLRRTVETRLTALGVSREIRAQLQSHGLGGVQGRHYDRHDYLSEKRAALEALHRLLVDASASVTLIRSGAR